MARFGLVWIFLWGLMVTAAAQQPKTTTDSLAQDSAKRYIKIVFAKKAKSGFGKDSAAQRLIGDVQLKHQDILMYCDSAYFYSQSNSIKAFSNVRLNQADTLFLTGNRINYSGETKIAEVIGNVALEDPTTFLECEHLFYYRNTNVGSYYTGGKIFSKDSQDTLTSIEATYYSTDKLATFKDSVILKNPEYIMETDTMHYSTEIKQSYFYGPTTITSDSNTIYCNAGWYNTNSNQSSFYNRATITGKEQTLTGDSLYYDRNLGLGEAFGNIILTDTINDLMVEGARAYSYQEGDSAIIPENPLLYYITPKDTLLMSSDTVYTVTQSDSTKWVYAFHDVRFHKSDIQGVCDSIIFKEHMERMDMIHDPILWSDANQITGDTISLFLKDQVIDQLFIPNSAFIGEKIETGIFNQLKGKQLTGYFVEQEMRKVEIRGNGESVYFALEEDRDSLGRPIEVLIGINKAICSDIDVRISDSKIDDITFITAPKSTLYPPQRVLDPAFTLKNFEWKGSLRPINKQMVRDRGSRLIKFTDPIVPPESLDLKKNEQQSTEP